MVTGHVLGAITIVLDGALLAKSSYDIHKSKPSDLAMSMRKDAKAIEDSVPALREVIFEELAILSE